MDAAGEKRILAVIPAFNEGERIGPVVRGVYRVLGNEADVLVVSDGATDDTLERAAEAGARVLRLPFNLGYGAALKTGYEYALRHGYEVVVQLDGDGQHDPISLPELVVPILNGHSKVVVGSRFLAGSSYLSPLVRRMGQWLFAVLLRVFSGIRVSDPTSGYQALHRDVLALFTSEEFPADYPDSDVLLLLYYKRIPFCEVPAVFHARAGGQSMHDGLRSIYYVYKMLLSMVLVAYRHRHDRRVQTPGAFAAGGR